ncbi:uncharacterized protein PHALS_14777 [Plasmopara halstedii]|uniref:Uncharacterized protein n=1 Tax=Plasmopara halstedii TaxID=4781 RepID=A0A0P1ARI4_PLAHL|nr:uncharacterized protein PHALS_14777 [Plasmopara halstedii]CEG44117.1 hypothetical protein PHALS_14777 [Plasmopara halstedii]|eukprot:XP_024580486.1 hypothetical protein PHALS_14777 [Plasmopara halstedii]
MHVQTLTLLKVQACYAVSEAEVQPEITPAIISNCPHVRMAAAAKKNEISAALKASWICSSASIDAFRELNVFVGCVHLA